MAKPGGARNLEVRKRVADMVKDGKSTREIARELDYSTQRIWKLKKEMGLSANGRES